MAREWHGGLGCPHEAARVQRPLADAQAPPSPRSSAAHSRGACRQPCNRSRLGDDVLSVTVRVPGDQGRDRRVAGLTVRGPALIIRRSQGWCVIRQPPTMSTFHVSAASCRVDRAWPTAFGAAVQSGATSAAARQFGPRDRPAGRLETVQKVLTGVTGLTLYPTKRCAGRD